MQDKKVLSVVIAALFAALTCVATMVITIPLPGVGFFNTGDCFVILSGILLGPVFGPLAAGIGAALADVLLSYVVYAPATFVIKALMALAAFGLFSVLKKAVKAPDAIAVVVAGVVAEIIMILGYFVFETALYGVAAAVPGLSGNAIQGAVGVILSTVILSVIIRNKYIRGFFATRSLGDSPRT